MFKYTISSGLNKQRQDKDGFHPLRIRVTIKGKPKYYPTGIKLKDDQWRPPTVDDIGAVINHGNKAHLNIVFRQEYSKVERVYAAMEITGQDVSAIVKKGGIKFHSYAKKRIEATTPHQSDYTTRNKYSELNKFNSFNDSILLKDMDNQTLSDYEAYCRKLGNSANTISVATKFVKMILNDAYKEGVIEKPALRNYTGAVYKDPPRLALEMSDLDKIEKFAVTSKRPTLVNVANWFLFACYSGLRYGDVHKFDETKVIGDRIVFRTTKGDADVSIKIHVRLTAVMGRLQGKVITNQKVNEYLKIVGEACNININMQFHLARHTFATRFLDNGGSLESLQKLMGHKKMATTAIYSHRIDKRIDREMDEAWDK